jgi:hypothetical protein
MSEFKLNCEQFLAPPTQHLFLPETGPMAGPSLVKTSRPAIAAVPSTVAHGG